MARELDTPLNRHVSRREEPSLMQRLMDRVTNLSLPTPARATSPVSSGYEDTPPPSPAASASPSTASPSAAGSSDGATNLKRRLLTFAERLEASRSKSQQDGGGAANLSAASPSGATCADNPSAASPSAASAACDVPRVRSRPLSVAQLGRGGYSMKSLSALPTPPERHPTTNWHNHYDVNAPIDSERVFSVARLLDRLGKPPKLAYLVEWDVHPCQLLWVWWTYLSDGLEDAMNEIDDWKASCAAGSTDTVSQYQRHKQRGATAGACGLCFLEAFQAALYSIKVEHVVNVALWDAYVKA